MHGDRRQKQRCNYSKGDFDLVVFHPTDVTRCTDYRHIWQGRAATASVAWHLISHWHYCSTLVHNLALNGLLCADVPL